MGATCCAERPPAHVRVHECFFPMYVVKAHGALEEPIWHLFWMHFLQE